MKQCSICKEEKELSEFYLQKNYSKKKGEYITYNQYCKKCCKEKSVKYQKDNPDKRKKYLKADNSRPERKQAKKEFNEKRRAEGKEREWQRNNKDKITNYRIKRMQNKKHEITKEEWESCKLYFNYSCAYCGMTEVRAKEKYKNNLHKEHVDHNGANDLSNCVPSCKSCNGSKNIKDFQEWYNESNPVYSCERYNKIMEWLLIFTEKIPVN